MSQPQATHPEETVWTGNVSQWHYSGRWLLVIVFFAAGAGTFFYEPTALAPYIWPVRGILGGIALFLILWIQFDRSRRKYTITNHRVIVEFGIVDKRSSEIRVQDIRSINLFCSGIAGMAGIGRVEFSSAAADDAEVIFWQVAGAEKVRDLVRSLQSAQ